MSLYDDVHRYEIGDLINLDVTFLDQSTGNPFDPEALSYTYKNPSGVIVTDVPSVKLSVGNYRAMVDATISGIWSWRCAATGNGQSAFEGRFYVKPSLFVG